MSLDPNVPTWPSIDPEDIDVLEFDYSVYALLTTITSASAQAEVLRGVHATPGVVLLGPAVINGLKVYQRVSQCVAGVHYKVRMLASFSDGRAQVLSGVLPCNRR